MLLELQWNRISPGAHFSPLFLPNFSYTWGTKKSQSWAKQNHHNKSAGKSGTAMGNAARNIWWISSSNQRLLNNNVQNVWSARREQVSWAEQCFLYLLRRHDTHGQTYTRMHIYTGALITHLLRGSCIISSNSSIRIAAPCRALNDNSMHSVRFLSIGQMAGATFIQAIACKVERAPRLLHKVN